MNFYNAIRTVSNWPLIKQLKHAYRRHRTKVRNKNFLTKGMKVLTHLDNVLKANNVKYSAVFGTLLGAIREKGFIKHDLDIDMAVWYDEVGDSLHDILTQNGFTFYRRIEVDGGKWGREETYYYDGVSIDFFYFYMDENQKMPYTTVYVMFPGYDNNVIAIREKGGMMPIQLFLPLSRQTVYTDFHSIQVPVTDNAIEFIEARYGKSWRIPDPTFVYPKMGDVSCTYHEDKVGIITK